MTTNESWDRMIQRMKQEPCRCISCPDCGGSGSLWVTLDGAFHQHRVDDMGDLETCDSYGSSAFGLRRNGSRGLRRSDQRRARSNCQSGVGNQGSGQGQAEIQTSV